MVATMYLNEVPYGRQFVIQQGAWYHCPSLWGAVEETHSRSWNETRILKVHPGHQYGLVAVEVLGDNSRAGGDSARGSIPKESSTMSPYTTAVDVYSFALFHGLQHIRLQEPRITQSRYLPPSQMGVEVGHVRVCMLALLWLWSRLLERTRKPAGAFYSPHVCLLEACR